MNVAETKGYTSGVQYLKRLVFGFSFDHLPQSPSVFVARIGLELCGPCIGAPGRALLSLHLLME